MGLSEILTNYQTIKNSSMPIKPYLLAEAGVNHEGSMDLAKRLIDEAAESGCNGIKFQTYKAETIASKQSPAYWDTSKESTQSQYELFKKYDKFWKTEYEKLKLYCDQAGIEFFSTPFDVESALFLNDLMDVFKISSSDITNIPFIRYISDFGKPIILSTGASNMDEIQLATKIVESSNIPYCLMHCILNYPTDNKNANLGMILDLINCFPNAIPGYSDHTLPEDMHTLEVASTLGAVVLEKHFTHDKTLPGNDHYHAMDKEDVRVFFNRIKILFNKLGSVKKQSLKSEEVSRQNARRSLVISTDIPTGTILTKDHMTWKRPATGISPIHFDQIIGKETIIDLKKDDILQWRHLK